MDNQNLVVIGKQTHPGRVRETNQDALGTPAMFGIDSQRQAERGILVAIADGMGGQQAGEVASQTAIETLFESYYRLRGADRSIALRAGFADANRRVLALARSDAAKTNMGTTLVAAVIQDAQLIIANVGDSRAYLIQGTEIRQVTLDHSWVAEQVRAGVLTAEQARRHIYRNVITRAIGGQATVEPDLFTEQLQPDHMLVLCSDGLSNMLAPQEILVTLKGNPNPDQAAQALAALANERGATDNVSVIVLSILNKEQA